MNTIQNRTAERESKALALRTEFKVKDYQFPPLKSKEAKKVVNYFVHEADYLKHVAYTIAKSARICGEELPYETKGRLQGFSEGLQYIVYLCYELGRLYDGENTHEYRNRRLTKEEFTSPEYNYIRQFLLHGNYKETDPKIELAG